MVGIGLGWLFFKQRSSSNQSRPPTYGYRDRWSGANVPHFDRYSDRYSRGDGDSRQDLDQGQGTVSQAMSGVQDRAGQFMDQAQTKASQVADQAQSMAGQVADQAQATAGQAFDMVQQGTQQVTGTVQGQFQQMLRDNPLALGGLAVAAGLAVGLAIPGTDKEDELLGDARDSVMQQAKAAAQDAQQKLQQVAQETGKAAQQEAKEQHLTA